MDKAGLTQEQLAEKIGVGQPAISMMLKRQCRPQKRTVQRLAEALGVAAEELWPGDSRT
jgi:transcriptional regulator with XRE-family HTH domain